MASSGYALALERAPFKGRMAGEPGIVVVARGCVCRFSYGPGPVQRVEGGAAGLYAAP
jgi:hypothetical protein